MRAHLHLMVMGFSGSSEESGFDHPVALLSSAVFGILTVIISLAGYQMRRYVRRADMEQGH